MAGTQNKLILVVAIGLIGSIFAWLANNTVLAFLVMIDAVLVALIMGALLLITQLIWNLARRSRNHPSKRRVRWAVFLCALVFVVLAVTANHYWLGHKFDLTALLVDGGVLVYAVFVGWVTAAPTRRRFVALVLMTVGLAVVLSIMGLQGSNANRKGQEPSIKTLTALPYITWAPVGPSEGKTGVTFYDKSRAFDGLNLYKSRNESSAHLMDMAGRVVHTWSAKPGEEDDWFHVEVCENGDLLVVVKDGVLIKLDWDSNVKWMKNMRSHHDVAVAENGDLFALAKEDEIVFSRGIPIPVLCDYIMVFSADDELKQKISLFRIVEDEIPVGINEMVGFYRVLLSPRTQLKAIRSAFGKQLIFLQGTAVDVMHSNSIEIIERDTDSIFRKGNVLFCSRTLDLIGVIDLRTSSLVWSWGQGVLDRPHHPTLLDNGNILVFDNGWSRRHFSRILELNPQTEEVVWEYQSDPPQEFFSPKMGASQRLPNGNTLITNSYSGQVFEVTPNGETVWEFYNPVVEEGRRAVIYRMERIFDRDRYSFLDSLQTGQSGRYPDHRDE